MIFIFFLLEKKVLAPSGQVLEKGEFFFSFPKPLAEFQIILAQSILGEVHSNLLK